MNLRRIVTIATIACAFSAQTALAHEDQHSNVCEMIPPNAQFFGVGFAGGISEATFNAVIDAAEKIYKPIFKSKGANFVVVRKWSDGTVNAYAEQSGTEWKVSMFGGLARHPETTPDGFAEVVCHEIGHHLAGMPKYGGANSWAAVEGQSDYYATLKCMHKIIAELPEWPTMLPTEVDPMVTERCNQAWPENETKQKICVRSSYGGLALSRLLASLNSEAVPNFNTPDKSKVGRTNENHPKGQCRLDTYFAGAVCNVDPNIETSQTDDTVGVCTGVGATFLQAMNKGMSAYTDGLGMRPGCWYSNVAAPPYEPSSCPLGDQALCDMLCQIMPEMCAK
ncbi:MAG: hypothetical protein V4692_04965 [Bdellovibrionota bacterium]